MVQLLDELDKYLFYTYVFNENAMIQSKNREMASLPLGYQQAMALREMVLARAKASFINFGPLNDYIWKVLRGKLEDGKPQHRHT